MRIIVALAVFQQAAGELDCHSLDSQISDAWCNSNCNNIPKNCPESICSCADGPTPSPSPSPSPAPSPPVAEPLFVLDLFVNDPNKGWLPEGFPKYLQQDASKYTNMAGISFIQPKDLMNNGYELPEEVAAAVKSLRSQGVAVQLLVGGEISAGWSQLEADPETAASNAVRLMKAHDCGIEVDCEDGGDGAGIVKFIQLMHENKPDGVKLSMDAAGTPTALQKTVISGAIEQLDWVNLMVSAPQYDQGNSVAIGHKDGIPLDKMTLAYYAGTWVNNCNDLGSGANGDLAAGIKLFEENSLKGLSIWAVGGASYAGCSADDAPGFAQAMQKIGAHTPSILV